MKPRIFMFLLFVLVLFLSGCNTASSPELSPNPPTQPSPPPVAPSDSKAEFLPPDNELKMYYRFKKDAGFVSKFERARALVDTQKSTASRELDAFSSFVFNNWIVLEFKNPPADSELVALDAPPPSQEVYFVDLTSAHLFSELEWNAARPFFNEILQAIQSASKPEVRKGLIHHLTRITAILGLGHSEFLGDEDATYPEGVTTPRLKITPNETVLTFYHATGGMTMTYTQNTLTITPTAITFEASFL